LAAHSLQHEVVVAKKLATRIHVNMVFSVPFFTKAIANNGIGMSGSVFEKLSDGLGCGFGGDGTDGNEHGGVDGVSVVHEGADDLLWAGDPSSG
jgi:hypothetical protein